MRFLFEGRALAYEFQHAFPADTIKSVVVSTMDGAPWALAPVNPNGCFRVDLSLEGGDRSRDTLKFFFFADEDILMAATACRMEHLLEELHDSARTLPGGAATATSTFELTYSGAPFLTAHHNHRTDNTVCLWLQGLDASICEAAIAAYRADPPQPSVLPGTDRFLNSYLPQYQDTTARLLRRTRVLAGNGGIMFTNLLSWHAMQDQAVAIPDLQDDMEPTDAQLDLLLESGILMYFVSDALHFTGHTTDDVLRMDGLGLTHFTATAIMTAQRSIWTAPYQPDLSMELEESSGRPRPFVTEHFKRMLGEPFNLGTHLLFTSLTKDDCDGQAVDLHVLTSVFRRLYERRQKDPSDPSLDTLFPAFLHAPPPDGAIGGNGRFDVQAHRQALLEIALRIGRDLAEGLIRSKIVFMAMRDSQASAGANEAGTGRIGGHVLHSLQSWHKPQSPPVDILNEGTNMFATDAEDVIVHFKAKSGSVLTPGIDLHPKSTEIAAKQAPKQDPLDTPDDMRLCMTEVVNELSAHMAVLDPTNSRVCIHVSDLSRYPKYIAAFCQGADLIGTLVPGSNPAPTGHTSVMVVEQAPPRGEGGFRMPIDERNPSSKGQEDSTTTAAFDDGSKGVDPMLPSSETVIQYGVAAADLGNYNVKTLIERVPLSQEEQAFLDGFRRARATEIHPPLVSREKLERYLRTWSPITPYLGRPALHNRRYMTCAISEAYGTHEQRMLALQRLRQRANEYNTDPSFRAMGYADTYLSTTAVLGCFNVYIDNADSIATAVKMALKMATQDRMQALAHLRPTQEPILFTKGRGADEGRKDRDDEGLSSNE